MIDEENQSKSACRVSVKAPSFNKDDAEIWFHQLEAQFEVSGIKADQTRYSYLLAALDGETVKCVREKILKPPEKDKYDDLKQAIIDRLSESAKTKLDKLLKGLQLGDRKPSQLLREMQGLAGSQIQDTVLQNLWLQRLPSQAQSILTSLEERSLDILASTADKILEVQSVAEICSINKNDSLAIDKLTNQVSLLTTQINSLLSTRHSQSSLPGRRSRSNRRSNSVGRDSSNGKPQYALCWYHYRFNDRARKCITPCNYKAQNNSEADPENK